MGVLIHSFGGKLIVQESWLGLGPQIEYDGALASKGTEQVQRRDRFDIKEIHID